MKKEKIVFIVNPKAGITPKSKFFVKLLAGQLLNAERFEPEVVYTDFSGHATTLAKQAIDGGASIVAGLGGDGTINEIAQALCGTDIPLGILPGGSGNGLARELGLPMDFLRALKVISRNRTRKIDAVKLNERVFVSIAGIGFDAHVAQEFQQSQFRGLLSYMRIILKKLNTYQPDTYTLIANGEEISRRALMITFANGRQFGFRAKIAPQAQIDDGFLDVCIVCPLTKHKAYGIAPRLFNGSLNKSKYYESFKTREIFLPNTTGSIMNIDGEPVKLNNDLHMAVMHKALNVLVP